ncbi:MAG: tetratricopeptide (TPR) repeat protein, partial [Paracoccaceae bacterium]
MTNLNTAILGAKTAIAQQDYGKARAILTPIAANNPTSAATLHLARVEFFEGKPEAAALLIARFQAASPKHAWAQLLNAQIQFSLGDYSAARNAAQTAIALNSNTSKPANRVLLSINAGEKDAEAKTLIKTLNLAKLEAGNDSFSSEVLDAAQSLSQFSLGPDWNDDPVNATIAYFRNAPNLDVALRNYDPHLIDVATRFDYITWPKRIQDHVIGKSVLDVGCGFGGYGMGFLVAGAVGYVGLDPVMELDSPCAKNKRTRAWEDM